MGNENLGEGDNSAVNALANIYKMFAASENNFSNNGSDGIGADANKPAKTKWWLPGAGIGIEGQFNAKKQDDTSSHANFTSTLNGIK